MPETQLTANIEWTSEDLNISIGRALSFLREQQLESGEFTCYFSQQPNMVSACQQDSSPFPTALICYSLKFCNSSQAEQMVLKAMHFLRAQAEPGGLWRYWTYKHPLHSLIPYDVDDTVSVSTVLQQNGVSFPDNRRLLLANRDRRGLFYTWFAPRRDLPKSLSHWAVVLKSVINPLALWLFWRRTDAKPSDIDSVVNANAVYYFGSSPETEASIDFLIDVVKQDKEAFSDKWHHSPFNLYYSLSRCYFGEMVQFECIRNDVIRKIYAQCNADGSIGKNVLETALAACSLLNWGCHSDQLLRAARFLVSMQSEAGGWPTHPMYYAGRIYNGPDHYFAWGSEALTTGFCLESLVRVAALMAKQTGSTRP
jgi:hypothetical protein